MVFLQHYSLTKKFVIILGIPLLLFTIVISYGLVSNINLPNDMQTLYQHQVKHAINDVA